MISASQCRSARTLLGWSVSKLSSAASVSESAIDDFELERRQPSATTIDAIQSAPLRMSGCCFSPKTTFNYGATCQRRGDDCRSDCQQRIGASPIHIGGPGEEGRQAQQDDPGQQTEGQTEGETSAPASIDHRLNQAGRALRWRLPRTR